MTAHVADEEIVGWVRWHWDSGRPGPTVMPYFGTAPDTSQGAFIHVHVHLHLFHLDTRQWRQRDFSQSHKTGLSTGSRCWVCWVLGPSSSTRGIGRYLQLCLGHRYAARPLPPAWVPGSIPDTFSGPNPSLSSAAYS